MMDLIDEQLTFEIKGTEKDDSEKDVSSIALMGDYVLVGSDEGNYLQVLKKVPDQTHYQQVQTIVLDEKATEIDIEGLARADRTVYVIGSCARVRKSMKPNKKTVAGNRKRLNTLSKAKEQRARCQLFRFDFDQNSGEAAEIKQVDLYPILSDKDCILSPFMAIPSKENGVDIEGIAVDGKTLYIGFRGPVLRGNFVPIMVTTFEHPKKYEFRYIKMGGRGIRDLTRVTDGFLIIGGPVGDGEMSYQIYFWDGQDQIPGTDRTVAPMQPLGVIHRDGAKAEAIALIDETDTYYDVLIAFDGLESGQPVIYRIDKVA